LWVVDDGAVVPFDGGYRAWREAIRDGWTVAGALEQEAARLRRGGIGPGDVGYTARRAGRERQATHAPVAVGVTGTEASGGARLATEARGAAAPASASTNGRRADPGTAEPRPKLPKLSKDAYRRQRETVDAELTRLGLRKNHLELELSRPAVQSNFIELRRVSSELAYVETALGAAEDAWLALEERAP
jgi:hypothetical protein